MNLLEHYIIEELSRKTLPPLSYHDEEHYIEVEVLCDCWGDKRICKHTTTRENWERELKQGYFLA